MGKYKYEKFLGFHIMNSKFLGGGYYEVIWAKEYPTSDIHLITDINMATKSREKRSRRREEETTSYVDNRTLLNNFKPRTWAQEDAIASIEKNDITVLYGAAGTGKTLSAAYVAVKMLTNKDIDKIIYVRSDTPTDYQRGRGALKGDYKEKAQVLGIPLIQNLHKILPAGAIQYYMNKDIISVFYLEDILGTSFDNAFVIFDEVQQSLPIQVRAVLTRIGKNTKMVLCGDGNQINYYAFRPNNGLLDAIIRLQDIKGIGCIEFTEDDIVRNDIIKDVIVAYKDVM